MSNTFNLNNKSRKKSILRNNACGPLKPIEHYSLKIIIIQECRVFFKAKRIQTKKFFPIVQVTIYCDEQPIKPFESTFTLNHKCPK